jgi:hypothetical protein
VRVFNPFFFLSMKCVARCRGGCRTLYQRIGRWSKHCNRNRAVFLHSSCGEVTDPHLHHNYIGLILLVYRLLLGPLALSTSLCVPAQNCSSSMRALANTIDAGENWDGAWSDHCHQWNRQIKEGCRVRKSPIRKKD